MYDLVGVDGNAYSIMGYTQRAMKEVGFEKSDIEQMHKDATSGDYNNLICVCVDWIDKCNERCEDE